jgi:AraC family transcriptional regulator
MEADIHTLYESDFYQILDFKCRCKDCGTSKPEYSTSFCISFVRKGNFLFNVFRHSLDSYNGCVLITKPGSERTVTHVHEVPDECTIFDFKMDFYNQLVDYRKDIKFFKDLDLHSTLVKTDAETEFLHFYITKLVLTKSSGKLEIDNLVIEMIEKVLGNISDYFPDVGINARLKRNHLTTIECAKDYIVNNYTKDISLRELSDYCCVSPFHFSRIFKTFTSYAPHQFLLNIRLKNAEVLLRNTNKEVSEVAFASGFNSIEYFTSAFKERFKLPPSKFKAASQRERSKFED